jgi:predicted pyridoxine 5'-phosphate oxidase superfamily flavin-nucleotide-binding protein
MLMSAVAPSSARSQAGSPFHEGEQAAQDRVGVRAKIDAFARRVVHDHMPERHREFYGRLPFVLVATVDDRGRPWASLVSGSPGFMATPDPRTLEIRARPLPGDPLNATLVPGADVGILGIELETRRRNRLSGQIEAVRPDGFVIAVRQAFGNCPQYIQRRAVEIVRGQASPAIRRGDRFDETTCALIECTDTLFIATAYRAGRGAASEGADVSHRGGRPGFVRLEDEHTFVFPDFSGNNHFNTIGNILLNPKAGILFVDFEAGDLVYTTGDAAIVWQGEQVAAFAGAERLIRLRAAEVIRVEGSLPLRFDFGDYSPRLDGTGSWERAAATITTEKDPLASGGARSPGSGS